LSIGNYHGFGDVKSARIHEYWASVNIRPLNSISVTIEPQYSKENNKLQYIETGSTDNDPLYLFGELDQETLSLTLRLNYTINPELSIEYYGQPFVSAGSYTNLNKITDPVADKFIDRYHVFTSDEISYDSDARTYNIDTNGDGTKDYLLGNPDFNFRQFRSNLVIRWEYSPGSTIYLVWSQGRTSTASTGLFRYGEDMGELFKGAPHNVFLLKFSYWFSL
jgi:hypothetical protein